MRHDGNWIIMHKPLTAAVLGAIKDGRCRDQTHPVALGKQGHDQCHFAELGPRAPLPAPQIIHYTFAINDLLPSGPDMAVTLIMQQNVVWLHHSDASLDLLVRQFVRQTPALPLILLTTPLAGRPARHGNGPPPCILRKVLT